jgi:hypothetical protein
MQKEMNQRTSHSHVKRGRGRMKLHRGVPVNYLCRYVEEPRASHSSQLMANTLLAA